MPLYDVASGAQTSVDGVVSASLDLWWNRDGIIGKGPVVAACTTTDSKIALFTWTYDVKGGLHSGTSHKGPPASCVKMSMLTPDDAVVAFENADGKLQVNCHQELDGPRRPNVQKFVSTHSVSTFVDIGVLSHLGTFVVAFADGDNNIRVFNMLRQPGHPIKVISSKAEPPLFAPPPGNVGVKGLALAANNQFACTTATMQSNQLLRVHEFGIGLDGTWGKAQQVCAMDLPSPGAVNTLVGYRDGNGVLHVTSWGRDASETHLKAFGHAELGKGSWIALSRVRDVAGVFATISQLAEGLQVDVWEIDMASGEFIRCGTHLVADGTHWARGSGCRSPLGILTACVNSNDQLELKSWIIKPKIRKLAPLGPDSKRIP